MAQLTLQTKLYQIKLKYSNINQKKKNKKGIKNKELKKPS